MTSAAVQRRTALLSAFFDKAPMKRTFGMELTYDDTGDATFHMPCDPQMFHSFQDTHGGVISTLLDNAGWFTAATRYDHWVNTSELTIRLHEPARQEALVGVGRIVRAGRRMCVAEMQVHSASGRLVATGSGCFVVSSRPIVLPDSP